MLGSKSSTFLFVGLVLAPIAVANGDRAPSSAHIEYRLGSDFSGVAVGSCDATALFLTGDRGGSIEVQANGGSWARYTGEFNSTVWQPPSGDPEQLVLTEDLQVTEHAIPRGSLRIDWIPEGRLDVYAAPGPTSELTKNFSASFSAPRLVMAQIEHDVPTVTTYDENDLGVWPRFNRLEGANRPVASSQGVVGAVGNLTLYLEGARVTASDGSVLDVPSRYETLFEAGAAGLLVRHTRVHYAMITLSGVQLNAPAPSTILYCRDLRANLDGTLNAYLARGRLESGSLSIEFEQQELRLQGSFDWSETVDGEWVRAEAAGTITAAALDFSPVLSESDALPYAVRAGILATFGAALGVLLWYVSKSIAVFFTRLSEKDVVDHPGRRVVLETIRTNPNITLYSLVRATQQNKSVVRYHVRVLETRGLVRSHKVGHDRCFVAKGTLLREGRALLQPSTALLFRNDPVMGAVVTSVPLAGTRLNPLLLSLSAELGLSRQGVWKAVARAERLGLVRRVHEGKEVWVRCDA